MSQDNKIDLSKVPSGEYLSSEGVESSGTSSGMEVDVEEGYAEVVIRDDSEEQDVIEIVRDSGDTPEKAVPSHLLSRFLSTADASSQSNSVSRSQADSISLMSRIAPTDKGDKDGLTSKPSTLRNENDDDNGSHVSQDAFEDNLRSRGAEAGTLESDLSIGHSNTVELFEVEEDVYTMIFASPVKSVTFWYAIFIIAIQLSILILATINLLREGHRDNIFSVPPYTPIEVTFAQAVAIFVTILVARDVTSSLDVFTVSYDDEVSRKFPAASYKKWVLSHTLRLVEGLVGVLVAFIFIVQSTDVLGLFLDFLVVQFVSEIDDIGFFLADRGYLPFASIQAMTKKMKTIQFQFKGSQEGSSRRAVACGDYMRKGLFGLSVIGLYAAWITMKVRQNRGYYYADECQRFQITFEDYQFDFFEKMCRRRSESCPETWKNRTEAVRYSSFNDMYETVTNADGHVQLHNHRPMYTQRGLQGQSAFGADVSPPGEIKYCTQENAWVFSVSGLSKGADADDCSWLMRSPKTDALTLGNVPEGDWQVWTGLIKEGSVDITCVECEDNLRSDKQTGVVDCNFHGMCSSDKRCECKFPFMGATCDVCAACPVLELNSFDNDDASGGAFLNNALKGKMVRLDRAHNEPMEIYNRPIYYHGQNYGSDEWLTEDDIIVVVYWGEQWVVWNLTDYVDIVADGKVELIGFFETFHSTWDLIPTKAKPWFTSELTKASSPNNLKWTHYDSGDVAEFNFACLDDREKTVCDYLL